jgi:hypothetical protein
MKLTGEQARVIAELSDGADISIYHFVTEVKGNMAPEIRFTRHEDGLRGTIAADGIFTHTGGPDPVDLGLTIPIK